MAPLQSAFDLWIRSGRKLIPSGRIRPAHQLVITAPPNLLSMKAFTSGER